MAIPPELVRRAAPVQTGARAFTLLEVMIVVGVMSILAIAVVPAMSSARGAQSAGAAREIERMLLLARAKAMSSGVSHCVNLRTSPSSLQICWRNPETAAVEPIIANDGNSWHPQPFAARFGSVRVSSVEVNGIAGDSAMVWFSFNGVPESRRNDGVRLGSATHDAVVTLSDGSVVTVVAKTGAVTVAFGGAP